MATASVSGMGLEGKEAPVSAPAPSTGSVAPASSTPSSPQPAAQTQAIKVGGKDYQSWDEVGKAYESLQSEHGKWTQKHGELEKQYRDAAGKAQVADQWNNWWKTIQPLWGDDVEGLLRKKLGGGGAAAPQPQSGQQNGQNPYEGWEMLPAQEQYQRLTQHIQGQMTQQHQGQMQQLAQAVQNHIQQREQWYQSYLTNHLSLMRKALERKVLDPKFDVDAVMEQAARAIGGQMDPLELGQQLLGASGIDARIEAVRKEAYEQAKRDLEQTATNKTMEMVPSHGAGAPVFKFTPSSGGPRAGMGSQRQAAAEALFKQFGADVFNR